MRRDVPGLIANRIHLDRLLNAWPGDFNFYGGSARALQFGDYFVQIHAGRGFAINLADDIAHTQSDFFGR